MTADPKTVTKKGKPSKVKDIPVKEVSEKKEPSQLIHHVIRTISRDGSGTGDSWKMQDLEEHIMNYLAGGWRLHATHYLGELPEGFTMLWVLLKN